MKFLENIQQALTIIKTSDYLLYMTYPLIKDKKLLLKIVSEIKKAITLCIGSILQYEYLHKRITLYQNPEVNFRTFREKCAPLYQITSQELSLILELFDIIKEHERSSVEFLREDKVVILSDNMRQKTLSVEKTKEFLQLSKNILAKTKERFIRKI